ncbi:thioredoxin domain-containing protein [Sphingomonas sp. AOB5]|uniref:thioredoxin domain-containing protein n=1 Tax=Sphingomonas sp. AOB5 TaxID=3034017 RepID=UPI0023F8179D|nr:thioredoxin domain-containing protein [Sphingomonas sp. AOB5]MDF7777448.1 thioredoxin domain-containing protein [Sphingomonas sp. AOB5]
MRIAFALIASLALAACGGGDGATTENGTTPEAPAASKLAPPAGKQWVDVVTKSPEGGMIQGNPDAPVKLVEYGSRSCPACQGFAMTGVEPLRAKYISTGQVSYEFRDFALHPQDLGLILIGQCVSPEAFFPILDQMYVEQQVFNERLTQEILTSTEGLGAGPQAKRLMEIMGYIDFMKQRGVPQAQLDKCLGDQAAIDQVAARQKAGVEKGVNSTPTFYINDKMFQGGWDDMERELRAAGAR